MSTNKTEQTLGKVADDQMIQVPAKTLRNVVDYVSGTGVVLGKAAAQKKAMEDFATAIPATVEKLIASGRLAPAKREKVAEMLRNQPAKALEYLQQLAGAPAAPAHDMGKPSTHKTANQNGADTRTADDLFNERMLGGL